MTSTATRPARGGQQNGKGRSAAADAAIIENIRAACPNSTADDIQAAITECNGDVQQAVMSLVNNPFQQVAKKKKQVKPAEKPAGARATSRDFPVRDIDRREYDRNGRGGRGRGGERGRDYDGPGGRAGRGRGAGAPAGGRGRGGRAPAREPEASFDIRPTTETAAHGEPAEQPGFTAVYEDDQQHIVPAVQPAPPRPMASVVSGGGSWAAKLKTSTAPPAQPPLETQPEAASDHGDILPTPSDGWGMPSGVQQDVPDSEHPADDDTFGTGFGHEAQPSSAWGPANGPAPDWSAGAIASADLNSADNQHDEVQQPFDAPPGMPPVSQPYADSKAVFDLNSLGGALPTVNTYGGDSKGQYYNLPKDTSATAGSYTQSGLPPANQLDMAFGVNQGFPPPTEKSDAPDKKDESASTYMGPSYAQFAQPQPGQTSQPFDAFNPMSDVRSSGKATSSYLAEDKKDAGYSDQDQHVSKSSNDNDLGKQEHGSDDLAQQPAHGQQYQQLPQDVNSWGMQNLPPDIYSMQRPANAQMQPGVMHGMQQMPAQGQMGAQYMNPSMPAAPYGAPGYGAPNFQQMGYHPNNPYMQPYGGNMQPYGAAPYGGYQPFAAQYPPGGHQAYGAPGGSYGNTKPYQGDFARGGSGGGGGSGAGVANGGRGRGGRGKPAKGRGSFGNPSNASGEQFPQGQAAGFGGYGDQGWGQSQRYDAGYSKDKQSQQAYSGYGSGGMPGYEAGYGYGGGQYQTNFPQQSWSAPDKQFSGKGNY